MYCLIVNKYIFKIQNKILLGHVLAHRYLHPRCYRSQYLELYYWLKKYNDLPQSRRIYRLAIKRMPDGYKSPTQPSKVKGIEEKIDPPKMSKGDSYNNSSLQSCPDSIGKGLQLFEKSKFN